MNELYLLGLHFHKLGLNVTCITNYVNEFNFYDANILKGPSHRTEHLKTQRQTIEEFKCFDWENSVGIGTITGYNNLRVIDIDGCQNYNFIEDLLLILNLPKNYEWVVKTGSLDGYHIYFYSELFEELEKGQVATSFPPNRDNIGLFDKIEILWDTHAVLPNSIHKSGHKYSFVNCKFPKSKPLNINMFRFKVIERLFLNMSEMERKKVYYKLTLEKFIDIKIPNAIEVIDLSKVDNKLFFIFDVETDGLIFDEKLPTIIQISWIIMDFNGVVYKKNTELISSNFDENSKAFEINKLNQDIINKIGKNPIDVFNDVLFDLKHCSVICSHNIDFDLTLLKNDFAKNLISFKFENLEKFCTMKWGHKKLITKFNTNPKFPKLTEVYFMLFNHEVNLIHNAQSDVTILAKCVKEILYKKEFIYN